MCGDASFFVFDIWDIDAKCFWPPTQRRAFVHDLGIRHVPVLWEDLVISQESVAELLQLAEGKSVANPTVTPHKIPHREGLVFKRNSPDRISFKAISNQFLLKWGS